MQYSNVKKNMINNNTIKLMKKTLLKYEYSRNTSFFHHTHARSWRGSQRHIPVHWIPHGRSEGWLRSECEGPRCWTGPRWPSAQNTCFLQQRGPSHSLRSHQRHDAERGEKLELHFLFEKWTLLGAPLPSCGPQPISLPPTTSQFFLR